MEELCRLPELKPKCIECPSCKHTLITDNEHIEIISGTPNVISIKHKNWLKTPQPKALHLCLKCGSTSSTSKSRLRRYNCKCANNPDPKTTTTQSTETYLDKMIGILSSENDTGIYKDSIAKAIVSSGELSNFHMESFVEALASGVVNGNITEISGIYSPNGKPKSQSHDDQDEFFFESSGGDIWNLEDIPEHVESLNPISVPNIEMVFANRKE